MMTRKDKHGILIIIAVSVFFLFVFAWSYRIKASAENYDHETLCRNEGVCPVIKLLIDKTDPWEQRDKERLAKLIRQIKDNLAENERLSIYILDETGTYSPSPVFDMCSPKRGDQANSLYENPRRIQMRFEEKFAAPLDNMLGGLLRPGIAAQSPILETIIGLRGNQSNLRLVIVSDMMQNSDALSLYKNHGVDNTSAKVNDLCRLPNHYKNVDVYYIDRPHLRAAIKQNARNFWNVGLNHMADNFSWQTL